MNKSHLFNRGEGGSSAVRRRNAHAMLLSGLVFAEWLIKIILIDDRWDADGPIVKQPM